MGILTAGGYAAFIAATNRRPSEIGQAPFGREAAWVEHASRTEPLMHEFVVRNRLTRPVSIRRIATSCKCTTAVPANREIGPGDQTRIAVTIRSFSPNNDGFNERVVVTTDAGDLILTLSGILPPISRLRAQPSLLTIARGYEADVHELRLDIMAPKNYGVKLVTSDLDLIGCRGCRSSMISDTTTSARYDVYHVQIEGVTSGSLAPDGGILRIRSPHETMAVPIIATGGRSGPKLGESR